MFDSAVEAAAGSRLALLHLGAEVHVEQRRAGCRKLVVAAAWADAHDQVDPPVGRCEDAMATERLVEVGPVGCPVIAETCPAELALVFHTSIAGARSLITDALNLRHRLPRLWDRVVAGEVQAWKARHVAQRTAHLSPMSAAEVDTLVAGQIELLAWRRFETVLDATLLHVDEPTYRRREADAAARRDVWAHQSSDGLRTLVARAAAGDVTLFLGLVERIADALADDGDEDPANVRRSKAIGVAAYPERALDLLIRHRDDSDVRSRSSVHDIDFGIDPEPQQDPTDPWPAAAPPAGWQNPEHGNYHQPTPQENADRYTSTDPEPDHTDEPDPAAADDGPDPAAADDGPDSQDRPDRPRGSGDPAADRRWPNTGGLDLSRAAPTGLDRARPTILIHLHLTDSAVRSGRGVVRTEHGPITVDQLRAFLGDACADIKVYPVLDAATVPAVDGYEIPPRLRRAVTLREPGSVFPFSPCTSSRMDLDHTDPYRHGGPPGQTSLGRLGPLARCEHRPKTVGRWRARQPDPGTYLWRSPQGWISLTTNQGTLVLGDTDWAHEVWRAAKQRDRPEPRLISSLIPTPRGRARRFGAASTLPARGPTRPG